MTTTHAGKTSSDVKLKKQIIIIEVEKKQYCNKHLP